MLKFMEIFHMRVNLGTTSSLKSYREILDIITFGLKTRELVKSYQKIYHLLLLRISKTECDILTIDLREPDARQLAWFSIIT